LKASACLNALVADSGLVGMVSEEGNFLETLDNPKFDVEAFAAAECRIGMCIVWMSFG
jgi:hypothetical protein